MIGHITYLTDEDMAEKFGRRLKTEDIRFSFDVEFGGATCATGATSSPSISTPTPTC